MGSLSLRPGDSLTVPRTALSVGFIRFVSSTNATQATGFRLFPRWDSPPTEHASLSLVALCSKNRVAPRSGFAHVTHSFTPMRQVLCFQLADVSRAFTQTC